MQHAGYRIVLATVSDTDSPWLINAAIRYGLISQDAAMQQHAWLRLMDSGLVDTPNGQILLAEHVEALKKDPILLSFVLAKAGPKLAERPTTLRMLTARLGSMEQWASSVKSYSSSPGRRYKSQAVLGEPDSNGCRLGREQGWKPRSGDQAPSIRVRFVHPVVFPTVTVHQAGGAGFVRTLTVWGPKGEAT